MNRRTFSLAALLLGLGGCSIVIGSCEPKTKTFSIRKASEVSVCCGFDLELTRGQPSLQIRTDDNILDEIVVREKAGRLTIEYERSDVLFYPLRDVTVSLTLPEVKTIRASSGASVQLAGFQADTLVMELAGGSRARVSGLQVTRFRLDASGGSSAHVSGRAETQEIALGGGSSYRATELETSRATVDAGGGSDVRISVSEQLTARVSGGSRLSYAGDPEIQEEVSGGASIRPRK